MFYLLPLLLGNVLSLPLPKFHILWRQCWYWLGLKDSWQVEWRWRWKQDSEPAAETAGQDESSSAWQNCTELQRKQKHVVDKWFVLVNLGSHMIRNRWQNLWVGDLGFLILLTAAIVALELISCCWIHKYFYILPGCVDTWPLAINNWLKSIMQ